MNDENLIIYKEMSAKEQRDFHAAGGRAAQAKRRQQKTMAELIEKYFSFGVKSPEAKAQLLSMGFKEEECTNKTAFLLNIAKHAAKGNSAFSRLMMDYGKDNELIEKEKAKIDLENKRLKVEIKERKAALKEQENRLKEQENRIKEQENRIELQKLQIEKLKSEMDQKSDVEDLTPLADLLKLDNEELEELTIQEQEQDELEGE